MNLRKSIGQLLVDSPVCSCNCLRADTFDCVQPKKKNRALPQFLDQAGRKHDAFVGLHCRFGQFLDGVLVVSSREGREAEDCLKFHKVLTPRLSAALACLPGAPLYTRGRSLAFTTWLVSGAVKNGAIIGGLGRRQ